MSAVEKEASAISDGDRGITDTLDLCLRTGELLMSNGAGAADVTITMDSLARHFGLHNAEIDVTFTALSMAYQAGPGQPSHSLLRQVKRRTIDFGDLTSVDHLVSAILTDQLDLRGARNRLVRIGSARRPRRWWAISLGWGAMCAGIAVMLGGGPVVVGVATVAAITIERLQALLNRRRLPTFYIQVVGGVVAVAFAVPVSLAPLDTYPSLVISANIVLLLAGVGFVGALQDALSGYYLTATARLLEALLSTAGIIAGVAGGLALSNLLGASIGQLSSGYVGELSLLALGIGATVAAAGFAYASLARKRVLLPIGLLSGGTLVVSRVIEAAGVGRMFSVALAAFVIGLLGYPMARRFRVPPLVIVISGVVPFLPGLTIYQGLAVLSAQLGTAENVAAGIFSMVQAASIALSLAAGVILGQYIAQPLASEARRLERRLAGPRLVGPIRWQTVRGPRRRHRRPGPN